MLCQQAGEGGRPAGAWWGEAEKGLILYIKSTGYPSLLREGDIINEFQNL